MKTHWTLNTPDTTLYLQRWTHHSKHTKHALPTCDSTLYYIVLNTTNTTATLNTSLETGASTLCVFSKHYLHITQIYRLMVEHLYNTQIKCVVNTAQSTFYVESIKYNQRCFHLMMHICKEWYKGRWVEAFCVNPHCSLGVQYWVCLSMVLSLSLSLSLSLALSFGWSSHVYRMNPHCSPQHK